MSLARRLGWITFVAVMLLLAACSGSPNASTEPQKTGEHSQVNESQEEPTQEPSQEPTQEPSQEPSQEPTPDQTESMEGLPPTALEAAATVMRILQNGDMAQLAAWVHPDKGLRFSPYANVDTKTDLVFTRDEVKGLMEDSKKRIWRSFPGSGELIELTFAEYYKRFVYDEDFIADAEIALNKGLGQSTTVNNLNVIYPKESNDFVEYYMDGTDPAHEGMDWKSLRLVFEKIGEDHALVGIIHDQWTP